MKPAQAIDSYEKFLAKILNKTTPVETVKKLTAVKNWLQKLNLADLRQCYTIFGIGGISKVIGCMPYYALGFVTAILSYKLYKYWKLKDELIMFQYILVKY